uniref:Uncharacterized protein n=1 Tax=Sphaerodactylus townsendi TaxID=933632 RepID=A0ACB8F506_9SAUR
MTVWKQCPKLRDIVRAPVKNHSLACLAIALKSRKDEGRKDEGKERGDIFKLGREEIRYIFGFPFPKGVLRQCVWCISSPWQEPAFLSLFQTVNRKGYALSPLSPTFNVVCR